MPSKNRSKQQVSEAGTTRIGTEVGAETPTNLMHSVFRSKKDFSLQFARKRRTAVRSEANPSSFMHRLP